MKNVLLLIAFVCLRIVAGAQVNSIMDRETLKSQALIETLKYLNLIPIGQEREYGFHSREEFKQVSYGEPYQVYFVVRENGKVFFKATSDWRVPVKVADRSVALITVRVKNHTAEIIDFGATRLAQVIQDFENSQPSTFERVLIRNTYLTRDFLAPQFTALCGNESAGMISVKESLVSKLFPIGSINQPAMLPADLIKATLSAEVK